MPFFEYIALGAQSKKIKGQIEADSISNAASRLRAQRLVVMSLVPATQSQEKTDEPKANILDQIAILTASDLAMFFLQLSILIKSGITISDSLYILERQVKKRKLKTIVKSVISQIEEGSSFSSALEGQSSLFNSYIRNMIVCGEEGGILEIVLERIADHLEEKVAFRTQLLTGLLYPSIVIIFGAITVIFLTGFVLPRFIPFLTSRGGSLPPVTQLLISTTDLVNAVWQKCLIAVGATGVLFMILRNFAQTKYFVDLVTLRIPIYRSIIKTGIIVQFADNLSSLIDSGVSIQDSLRAVRNTLNNEVAIQTLSSVEERISHGEDLSTPIREASLIFPEMVAEMISVGEQTGGLEQTLFLVAQNYKKLLEKKIKRMTALIEPLIIVVLGAVVGFVVWALMAGVLSMYGAYNA